MSGNDLHRITDEAALREVVGPGFAGAGLKVDDKLDEFAVEFISRSPFLVLSTADVAGNVDASPKGDEPGFAVDGRVAASIRP